MDIRKRIVIQGIVQGVGFRPFVYREAVRDNLKGFVRNTSEGVQIEVEGDEEAIHRFMKRLQTDTPSLAKIVRLDSIGIGILGSWEFTIETSLEQEERTVLISPDIGICDDCIRELFDPDDRRYRYPFINCTHCGPRYSIILDIPYDRPATTMRDFNMCDDCRREYETPADRRFHAQPNACPVCGPKVWLCDGKGKRIRSSDPLTDCVELLQTGAIVAVKGLGGFHLACDATREDAVKKLRLRKGKEEKPLAVMATDIDTAAAFAFISSQERDLLLTPRRPIVLLEKKHPNILAESVAHANRFFGIMLPYTPLHHLLVGNFTALVMTSGNLSEEPIAINNTEAVGRLGNIADAFLMHNRDIHLRVDDSVTRIMASTPRPVRRSRGIVPQPVLLSRRVPCILAVGAELKNTLCYTHQDRAFISQHIGDLENAETLDFFGECADHLRKIFRLKPVAIAHDLHPDYLSTRWALDQDLPCVAVQHHHAHIASCMAENGYDQKVIGLALDGTGYGSDGAVWGGEILIADQSTFERAGHLAYCPMPGGAAAIKQPWRMALSYIMSAIGNRDEEILDNSLVRNVISQRGWPENKDHIRGVLQMIQRNIYAPQTSSLGRLFDGVSALIGLRTEVNFEGQAAMELEMCLAGSGPDSAYSGYPFTLESRSGVLVIRPDLAVIRILEDVRDGLPAGEISFKFHRGVTQVFHEACVRIREMLGISTVAMSGGCFQNKFLLENLLEILQEDDFTVLTHSQVPANDGGISLGQAVIASRRYLEIEKGSHV